MSRLLFCKTFGLGNAIMAVPAIRALRSMGHSVDLLVGSKPDDRGAYEVLQYVKGVFNSIFQDSVPLDRRYAAAICSIPFDGRWADGVHFNAERILDGRTRPDPSTTGLVSWKKHEVEYQMENAELLGFTGEVPTCHFWPDPPGYDPIEQKNQIYFGVGYKKDAAGFWKVKHWGNTRFIDLARALLEDDPKLEIVMTGDMADYVFSIKPIVLAVNNPRCRGKIVEMFDDSFYTMYESKMYVGNDTGMMHVAASMDKPVFAVFNLENSITKSAPWYGDPRSHLNRCTLFDGTKEDITPARMFKAIKEWKCH